MSRHWKSTAELIAAMRARADAGQKVVLSPETTRLIAMYLSEAARPRDRFSVDLYKEGSTVYRIDDEENILKIDAWARSTIVARAAYEALLKQYPNERFQQRRGGWVESG